MNYDVAWAFQAGKWLPMDPVATGGNIKLLLAKLRLQGIPCEPGIKALGPPKGKARSLLGRGWYGQEC
jgi:hypothetical protein